MFAVSLECGASCVGETVCGAGPFTDELLVDSDVSRGFEAGHMRRDVACGKTGLAGEEHEVGFVDHIQVGYQNEPGWFVDQPVEVQSRCLARGVFGWVCHAVSTTGLLRRNRASITVPVMVITTPAASIGQPGPASAHTVRTPPAASTPA